LPPTLKNNATNCKKKMPPIKKTFSNSTNTFAPNCPKFGKKLLPIVKNAPN